MSLDLTPGSGNLLGEFYWELISPWRGASSTLNTGASPRDAVVSSLSLILQADPPPRYYLTKTACRGILRRAAERGKELPFQLKIALLMQAGLIRRKRVRTVDVINFAEENCLTPWDTQQERIFLPDGVAPTLSGADGGGGRNPAGLLYTAGFCAGASPSAGGIGYTEDGSPTLKAGESGTNMVPSILCLNDQGGKRMDLSDGVSGSLRSQEKGHQPLVLASQQGGAEIGNDLCPTITSAAGTSSNNQPVLFENHGIDARYTGPHPVAPTMSARYGTGFSEPCNYDNDLHD